ncbi:MAG: YbgC/FadM family acyl-CoA thioesterase [Deltaproteobacteria bacterium]|nr:YbgC/FadM family acyl-CoA thioesterase [Deltaproteobacteria bacterium]
MRLPIRIYYEDTDCGGVVYYANYLKYFERGRTEFLRELGVSLPELREKGVVFVVRKAEVEYLSPCRYDDLLYLETGVSSATGATITFKHSVRKEGFDAEAVRGAVVLAAVGSDGRPKRVPEELKAALKAQGL